MSRSTHATALYCHLFFTSDNTCLFDSCLAFKSLDKMNVIRVRKQRTNHIFQISFGSSTRAYLSHGMFFVSGNELKF